MLWPSVCARKERRRHRARDVVGDRALVRKLGKPSVRNGPGRVRITSSARVMWEYLAILHVIVHAVEKVLEECEKASE